MRRSSVTLLVLALAAAMAGPASSAPTPSPEGVGLQMYAATVSAPEASRLAEEGYDVTSTEPVVGGLRVGLVLSPSERAKLRAEGVALTLWRSAAGLTQTQLAAAQLSGGYTVWRSYDEPGGIRDEAYALAAANPTLVKLVVIGHSLQGREIVALKVTKDATKHKDGKRPAVLYTGGQHAREWIGVEVVRRLLHHVIANAGDKDMKKLLDKTELWFVLVMNPDGYQHTFDHERLWRKNLRDNDGDGFITNNDGVDPNRNYPEHWNYDNEGSSSQTSSETFRGTAPASEPETQATLGLYDRVPFIGHVNYHSFGQLLLYPFGWQVETPAADDPIYLALSGTDDAPAITGYDPGVGADLYTTNGETNDWSYSTHGTLSWTPELSEGCDGCGFVFPDDEAAVQAEFERNLPFAMDVAMTAQDPDDPVSHLGNTVQPFYPHAFAYSYGDPQIVETLAKRSLGKIDLHYRINGGKEKKVKNLAEWNGGERFGAAGDVYYRTVRGQITGTSPGDSVEVWFKGEKEGHPSSSHFTYQAVEESDDPVLVVAAEDYTGRSPGGPYPGPLYTDYYTDALSANGVGSDVYDVDARGRIAPDNLGVLSHYDAVIWYTGEDVITRSAGPPPQPAGTAARLADDEMLEFRDYLNEGGKLLYTGQYAGFQYAFGYAFDPDRSHPECPSPASADCKPLSDDFLQYYLGGYTYNDDAGTDHDTGNPFDLDGNAGTFSGGAWTLNGPDSADNQFHTASFLATSGILPPSEYPQFASDAAVKWDRPGGPFQPHTGEYYLHSQIADRSYKRVTRTIDLSSASSADLSFWTSFDTEPDWDYLFVEAHTVGMDNWTTLADSNGNTSTDTGLSCPAGWIEDLHPHLAHYQTHTGDTCAPAGSSGTWNAATGNSGGWQEWEVNLSPFLGDEVEVSISYVSDWATQGLGVFLDDVTVTVDGAPTSTSFESDLGGWSIPGSPPGSTPNPNDFHRVTAAGFPEGAVISTEDSLYFGFGFEGLSTPVQRADVMDRALAHLGL